MIDMARRENHASRPRWFRPRTGDTLSVSDYHSLGHRDMKPWDRFLLVSGYLAEIDRLPRTALDLGLQRRIAVVLEDNDAPHSPLYWDVIEGIVESLSADGVMFEFEIEKDKTLFFDSVSSMRTYVESHPQVGRPFNRATFCLCGRPHAFIDVEPWACCGGPYPYYDSWTFAIYHDLDDMTRLRAACYRVCRLHGWPILEEIHGLAAPRPVPRWKRLVQWLIQ